MNIKLVHILFLLLAVLGGLYVWHMYTMHNTKQILPGLGIGGK